MRTYLALTLAAIGTIAACSAAPEQAPSSEAPQADMPAARSFQPGVPPAYRRRDPGRLSAVRSGHTLVA